MTKLQIRGSMRIIFFLFLDECLCCGYSLEAPCQSVSDEYPQHMFSLRNKKTISTFSWKKMCHVLIYCMRKCPFWMSFFFFMFRDLMLRLWQEVMFYNGNSLILQKRHLISHLLLTSPKLCTTQICYIQKLLGEWTVVFCYTTTFL